MSILGKIVTWWDGATFGTMLDSALTGEQVTKLRRGDLVDVSVDGVQDWRYVHAEPYLSDDAEGSDRLVIPYRDLEDGGNVADIDVDPYEVMQARQLHMN